MPIGAVLLVELAAPLPAGEIRQLRIDFLEATGLLEGDYVEADGPLVNVENKPSAAAYIPIERTGGGRTWLDANLEIDHYAPGYERGNLPLLVRCAEWLEERLPGSQIWYGHDADHTVTARFDRARREALLAHYATHGNAPYNK